MDSGWLGLRHIYFQSNHYKSFIFHAKAGVLEFTIAIPFAHFCISVIFVCCVYN